MVTWSPPRLDAAPRRAQARRLRREHVPRGWLVEGVRGVTIRRNLAQHEARLAPAGAVARAAATARARRCRLGLEERHPDAVGREPAPRFAAEQVVADARGKLDLCSELGEVDRDVAGRAAEEDAGRRRVEERLAKAHYETRHEKSPDEEGFQVFAGGGMFTLLPPPSAARDRLCAGALQAALRRHAQGARRALSLSTHSQGCPGGIIADEPEEHSLVAEFGMYYK